MYNVVYEYNLTSGGLYGVRTWIPFKSKEEFEKHGRNYTDQDVVKQDVSEDEAINLASLTPEICRLMGAIEQTFIENPNPSSERIKFSLTNAQYAIAYDRERIRSNGLERLNAGQYIDHFRKLVSEDLSLKSASMKGILTMCYNRLGQMI